MSTDDSISEDVSTSGALSHCHASADGDGGKESEISCVSSEGTSASCLAGLEDGHSRPPKTSEGGKVGSRPMDMSPACDKIRWCSRVRLLVNSMVNKIEASFQLVGGLVVCKANDIMTLHSYRNDSLRPSGMVTYDVIDRIYTGTISF